MREGVGASIPRGLDCDSADKRVGVRQLVRDSDRTDRPGGAASVDSSEPRITTPEFRPWAREPRLRESSGMASERQGTGLYLIASPNELAQTTRLRCTEHAKSKNLDQPLASPS